MSTTHSPSTPAAVAIRRPSRLLKNPSSVWRINSIEPQTREQQLYNILGDTAPLHTKCDIHARPSGQCCKDLKGDDERHLISPEIVRDMYIILHCPELFSVTDDKWLLIVLLDYQMV